MKNNKLTVTVPVSSEKAIAFAFDDDAFGRYMRKFATANLFGERFEENRRILRENDPETALAIIIDRTREEMGTIDNPKEGAAMTTQKNEPIRVEFLDVACGLALEFAPGTDQEFIDAVTEEIRIGKSREKLEEIYRKSELRKKQQT